MTSNPNSLVQPSSVQPGLSSPTHPGYAVYDTLQLGISLDIVERSSVELTQGAGADLLQPLPDTDEDRHMVFSGGPLDVPFRQLPALWELSAGVVDLVRRQALDPNLANESQPDTAVPHSGLADWSPTKITLDRYVVAPGAEPHMPLGFQSAGRLGGLATAIVQLHGMRSLEFNYPDRDAHVYRLLSPGKIAVVAASAALETANADTIAAPDFRTATTYPSSNNLLLTFSDERLTAA